MDDVVDRKKIAADEWYHELKQTDIGVQRVKNWSQYDGHLEDGDIFISADVDEVIFWRSAPSAEVVRDKAGQG